PQCKRQESWESVGDEVNKVVGSVISNTGKTVKIGKLVFKLTENIIYHAAFESNSQEDQDEFILIRNS
ncbi:hypothetical protein HN51_041180, partial [Arachis hypogaea]